MLWPAVFGLLGVIAGGLVTYWTQLRLAARNERARTLAGAQILLFEIAAVKGVLAYATSFGSQAARLHAERVFDVWTEYRADLVRLNDWEPIADALAQLAAVAPLAADRPIPKGGTLRLQKALARANRSLQEQITELSPPPQRPKGQDDAVPDDSSGARGQHGGALDADQPPEH
jgi:hypothetical protein